MRIDSEHARRLTGREVTVVHVAHTYDAADLFQAADNELESDEDEVAVFGDTLANYAKRGVRLRGTWPEHSRVHGPLRDATWNAV